MAVILEKDLERGRAAFEQWCEAARAELTRIGVPTAATPASTAIAAIANEGAGNGDNGTDNGATGITTMPASPAPARLAIAPKLPRPVMAMAVRYSLFLLERKAPGPGVEVRVAPWGAIKILDGPASDPHNLTPPDVIELDPQVWLRLAAGITSWNEEKEAGHISAVGERDNLGWLLPLRP
ncbi:serine-pyruvate aminotransferase [Bifidobacterium callitrichos]|uniref:Serine-pyruvate aminotransferase n=1 Tax=Bifidobacterium callitrichos TaxID=762209 RepID=A0A2T3G8G7_9BIFI|nr:sterol carrier family protein [Bifidobacterium callitrichos]PST45748.1 serine-pyruvate aminotransferase [Bifidobacterium callitrichos]